MACGILVPWPGIEPASLRWRQILNPWATREVPKNPVLVLQSYSIGDVLLHASCSQIHQQAIRTTWSLGSEGRWRLPFFSPLGPSDLRPSLPLHLIKQKKSIDEWSPHLHISKALQYIWRTLQSKWQWLQVRIKHKRLLGSFERVGLGNY